MISEVMVIYMIIGYVFFVIITTAFLLIKDYLDKKKKVKEKDDYTKLIESYKEQVDEVVFREMRYKSEIHYTNIAIGNLNHRLRKLEKNYKILNHVFKKEIYGL